MGGCQNHGPFLGILNIRCRIIIRYPRKDHNFDNHQHVFHGKLNDDPASLAALFKNTELGHGTEILLSFGSRVQGFGG